MRRTLLTYLLLAMSASSAELKIDHCTVAGPHLEEMRKALNESRVDETQAKDLLERLRRNVSEPEPMTTAAREVSIWRISNLAWAKASFAATTPNWIKREILRASLELKCSRGS